MVSIQNLKGRNHIIYFAIYEFERYIGLKAEKISFQLAKSVRFFTRWCMN